MKWSIEKFNRSIEQDWDEFIENKAINSTFLHMRSFINHNPLNIKEDCSYVFLKKGKIAACIPAVIYVSEGRKIWHSHYRATYGGLVVSEKVGIEDVLEITRLLEEELIKNQVNEAIIRNTFRVFNRKFCDEFDYCLWKSGYVLKSRETEIGLSIQNKTYQDIEKHYENGNKYNIKKSIKTVEVHFSDDFRTFWTILENNLKQRHNQKPVHDYEAIVKLKSILKPGEIKLLVAFEKEEMIGGIVLFDFLNKYLHAQYIASRHEYQNVRPVNAVIDYAIKWACKNKYEYFNLGTPHEKNGDVVNLGLSYFKEGFGGSSCLRETMHKIYTYD